MTTLTLRYRKGYFVVSGPDTQPTWFRSRREAKDWCHKRGSEKRTAAEKREYIVIAGPAASPSQKDAG